MADTRQKSRMKTWPPLLSHPAPSKWRTRSIRCHVRLARVTYATLTPSQSLFIPLHCYPCISHGGQRCCYASGTWAERRGERGPRRGTNCTGRRLPSRDSSHGIQQRTSFSAAPKGKEVLPTPRAHSHQPHASHGVATVAAVSLTQNTHSPMALELPTELHYRGPHLRNNSGGDAYTSR